MRSVQSGSGTSVREYSNIGSNDNLLERRPKAIVGPGSRGGMSANPFGGEDRIDRINLLDYLEPNAAPSKVLFLNVIQDAASNYLYTFLGKNGTSAEEFFYAYQYFFKVESKNRGSWDHHRSVNIIYTYQGKKIMESRSLTDSELQFMCFDWHFVLSGLENYMDINKFRDGLKAKRRKILTANWPQVQAYVESLYQHEVSLITDGNQVPLRVWDEDLLEILIDPPTPLHLANAIFVPLKLKRSSRASRPKEPSVSKNAALAERIVQNDLPSLGSDWGPLSALLGDTNAEVVRDHSNSSVHSAAH